MDYGLLERDYWDMTVAELIRYTESRKRIQELEAKEKATYDYILAELIGRSISRIYSSTSRYPSLAEAYPSLFSSQEIKEAEQAKRDELSVLRFKQFAQFHNDRRRCEKNINE